MSGPSTGYSGRLRAWIGLRTVIHAAVPERLELLRQRLHGCPFISLISVSPSVTFSVPFAREELK